MITKIIIILILVGGFVFAPYPWNLYIWAALILFLALQLVRKW